MTTGYYGTMKTCTHYSGQHSVYYYFDTGGDPDHEPPYHVIVKACDHCSEESSRRLTDEDLAKIWNDKESKKAKKRTIQFLKPAAIARARKYADDYGGTQKGAIDLALKTVTPKQLMTMPPEKRVPPDDGVPLQARITKDSRARLIALQEGTGQARSDIVYHALEVLRDKWEIEAE